MLKTEDKRREQQKFYSTNKDGLRKKYLSSTFDQKQKVPGYFVWFFTDPEFIASSDFDHSFILKAFNDNGELFVPADLSFEETSLYPKVLQAIIGNAKLVKLFTEVAEESADEKTPMLPSVAKLNAIFKTHTSLRDALLGLLVLSTQEEQGSSTAATIDIAKIFPRLQQIEAFAKSTDSIKTFYGNNKEVCRGLLDTATADQLVANLGLTTLLFSDVELKQKIDALSAHDLKRLFFPNSNKIPEQLEAYFTANPSYLVRLILADSLTGPIVTANAELFKRMLQTLVTNSRPQSVAEVSSYTSKEKFNLEDLIILIYQFQELRNIALLFFDNNNSLVIDVLNHSDCNNEIVKWLIARIPLALEHETEKLIESPQALVHLSNYADPTTEATVKQKLFEVMSTEVQRQAGAKVFPGLFLALLDLTEAKLPEVDQILKILEFHQEFYSETQPLSIEQLKRLKQLNSTDLTSTILKNSVWVASLAENSELNDEDLRFIIQQIIAGDNSYFSKSEALLRKLQAYSIGLFDKFEDNQELLLGLAKSDEAYQHLLVAAFITPANKAKLFAAGDKPFKLSMIERNKTGDDARKLVEALIRGYTGSDFVSPLADDDVKEFAFLYFTLIHWNTFFYANLDLGYLIDEFAESASIPSEEPNDDSEATSKPTSRFSLTLLIKNIQDDRTDKNGLTIRNVLEQKASIASSNKNHRVLAHLALLNDAGLCANVFKTSAENYPRALAAFINEFDDEATQKALLESTVDLKLECLAPYLFLINNKNFANQLIRQYWKQFIDLNRNDYLEPNTLNSDKSKAIKCNKFLVHLLNKIADADTKSLIVEKLEEMGLLHSEYGLGPRLGQLNDKGLQATILGKYPSIIAMPKTPDAKRRVKATEEVTATPPKESATDTYMQTARSRNRDFVALFVGEAKPDDLAKGICRNPQFKLSASEFRVYVTVILEKEKFAGAFDSQQADYPNELAELAKTADETLLNLLWKHAKSIGLSVIFQEQVTLQELGNIRELIKKALNDPERIGLIFNIQRKNYYQELTELVKSADSSLLQLLFQRRNLIDLLGIFKNLDLLNDSHENIQDIITQTLQVGEARDIKQVFATAAMSEDKTQLITFVDNANSERVPLAFKHANLIGLPSIFEKSQDCWVRVMANPCVALAVLSDDNFFINLHVEVEALAEILFHHAEKLDLATNQATLTQAAKIFLAKVHHYTEIQNLKDKLAVFEGETEQTSLPKHIKEIKEDELPEPNLKTGRLPYSADRVDSIIDIAKGEKPLKFGKEKRLPAKQERISALFRLARFYDPDYKPSNKRNSNANNNNSIIYYAAILQLENNDSLAKYVVQRLLWRIYGSDTSDKADKLKQYLLIVLDNFPDLLISNKLPTDLVKIQSDEGKETALFPSCLDLLVTELTHVLVAKANLIIAYLKQANSNKIPDFIKQSFFNKIKEAKEIRIANILRDSCFADLLTIESVFELAKTSSTLARIPFHYQRYFNLLDVKQLLELGIIAGYGKTNAEVASYLLKATFLTNTLILNQGLQEKLKAYVDQTSIRQDGATESVGRTLAVQENDGEPNSITPPPLGDVPPPPTGGPPPPPSSVPPPPSVKTPPPTAGGGRGALLSSIQGFGKDGPGLKKTVTNSRSAAAVGGGRGKPQSGGGLNLAEMAVRGRGRLRKTDGRRGGTGRGRGEQTRGRGQPHRGRGKPGELKDEAREGYKKVMGESPGKLSASSKKGTVERDDSSLDLTGGKPGPKQELQGQPPELPPRADDNPPPPLPRDDEDEHLPPLPFRGEDEKEESSEANKESSFVDGDGSSETDENEVLDPDVPSDPPPPPPEEDSDVEDGEQVETNKREVAKDPSSNVPPPPNVAPPRIVANTSSGKKYDGPRAKKEIKVSKSEGAKLASELQAAPEGVPKPKPEAGRTALLDAIRMQKAQKATTKEVRIMHAITEAMGSFSLRDGVNDKACKEEMEKLFKESYLIKDLPALCLDGSFRTVLNTIFRDYLIVQDDSLDIVIDNLYQLFIDVRTKEQEQKDAVRERQKKWAEEHKAAGNAVDGKSKSGENAAAESSKQGPQGDIWSGLLNVLDTRRGAVTESDNEDEESDSEWDDEDTTTTQTLVTSPTAKTVKQTPEEEFKAMIKKIILESRSSKEEKKELVKN